MLETDHGGMAQSRQHSGKPIERRRPMGAAPLDLYDYLHPVTPTGRQRHSEKPITVTDDWPEIVPVTEAEVCIIEAYFGDILDELFGPLP
ncbi:hypothetical protein [Rhodophyticola porphyridii]|uniref:hypothetical protein n=1 Tax=Rhodophyticola porphyridii TaxID=1852017 RepID=UPI0035CFB977